MVVEGRKGDLVVRGVKGGGGSCSLGKLHDLCDTGAAGA